ncbi:MAG: helix-turn-helix domain-containing protein [Chloroflexota bacterium]|nr:helix-turn-helix domain-containing protein [Chloroflexota bacterium]
MISVADVIALALPRATQVVGGKSGLGREVTWATRLRPAPPAFGHLSGGELVLLPANVLEQLDERLTLEDAIRQLATFGVAAIAQVGRATAGSRAAADAAGVALLQLPVNTDLAQLERDTARFISERRRDVQRRGQDVGQRLMELAIAGEPLGTLVQTLADLAGRGVALEGRDGRFLAYHRPAATKHGPDERVAAALLNANHADTGAWLRATAATSAADPPTTTFELDKRWSRVVAPVSGREGLLGAVSLLTPHGGETPEDALLTARGAAACAMVLAREWAATNARREIELNVLDELLDGALRSEVSLLQQARRLGHDLNAPHVALIARLDPVAGSPVRARDGRWSALDEVMNRASATRETRALWRVRNNAAELLWPLPTAADVDRLIQTVREELVVAAAAHATPEVVSLGAGRPGAGLAELRRSHREARQALLLGRRIHGTGQVTKFDDLGVYRVIYAAESLPEVRVFHDETLTSLLAYDTHHGAELVRTLEAFFAARCGPKEAAALLHVHRNTVLYRLERIREITGLDLDAADVRLRLQLALHIHQALFAPVT